jgi:hypothetical protein
LPFLSSFNVAYYKLFVIFITFLLMLQNFIYKYIANLENVQRKKKNEKKNLQDVKLAQTGCQKKFHFNNQLLW